MFSRYLSKEGYVKIFLSNDGCNINIDGIVLDQTGKEIIKFEHDGEFWVYLSWYDGDRNYKISEVLSHTFKPIRVPFKYWNQITVRYLDGNSKNIHPSNLAWKFPIGLGEKDYNGFSFIPTFSRYLVNRDGLIFDRLTNKISKGHANRQYVSFSLTPDIGHRTSLKRHRALCLAYSDYPVNCDKLQVNHINGKPGDDKLENLEWVTASQNIIHAFQLGLRASNKKIEYLTDGEETTNEFLSIREAADYFKKSEKFISDLILSKEDWVRLENTLIRFKSKLSYSTEYNKTKIDYLNLKTKEFKVFNSVSECSEHTGLTKEAIFNRYSSDTVIHDDGQCFRKSSDNFNWDDYKNIDPSDIHGSWKKKILIKDIPSGTIHEFESQRFASRFLNLSESHFYAMLNHFQKVFYDENRKTYFLIKKKNDTAEWKQIENPEKEFLKDTLKRKVLVKDIRTDEVFEFDTAVDCANKFNIGPTNLNWRLKSKGQILYKDGFMFKYKYEPLDFKEIDPLLKQTFRSSVLK
jgi:NUMOD1 domain